VPASDSDTDRAHAKAFVKDSAITSKIKTRLAAEHITSLLAMLESPHFCCREVGSVPTITQAPSIALTLAANCTGLAYVISLLEVRS
jgi:hypothetical protein